MKEIDSSFKIEIDLSFEKKGDLLYFEGPILSHFYDKNGSDYLFLWVDKDDQYNRWLIIKVNNRDLFNYFSERKSLSQIIETKSLFFLFDFDNESKIKNKFIQTSGDLPEEYLPTKNSFFNIKFANKYAKYLKNEIENVSKIAHFRSSRERIQTIKGIKVRNKIRHLKIDENLVFNFKNDLMVLASTIEPVSIVSEIYAENKIFSHLLVKSQRALISPNARLQYFYELNNAINKFSQYHNEKNFLTKIYYFTRDISLENPDYKNRYSEWVKTTFKNNEFEIIDVDDSDQKEELQPI